MYCEKSFILNVVCLFPKVCGSLLHTSWWWSSFLASLPSSATLLRRVHQRCLPNTHFYNFSKATGTCIKHEVMLWERYLNPSWNLSIIHILIFHFHNRLGHNFWNQKVFINWIFLRKTIFVWHTRNGVQVLG